MSTTLTGLKIFTALSTSCLLLSCVSVNLGRKTVQKSSDYTYSEPSRPFELAPNELVDRAWRDTNTGNTISIVSDCPNQDDPTLESISAGVTSGIKQLKIIKEEKTTFNQREALRSEIEGQIDGLATQMDIVTFKKNGCIYVLTYLGVQQHFQLGRTTFEKFLNGFRVP